MISERLCDAEDWSNDAENSAWHHRNKITFEHIQIEKSCNYISQFCYIFHKIITALVSDSLPTPNFWTKMFFESSLHFSLNNIITH